MTLFDMSASEQLINHLNALANEMRGRRGRCGLNEETEEQAYFERETARQVEEFDLAQEITTNESEQ